MNQLSEGSRTRIEPQQRPSSLDLILQARAMRGQLFASALARLSSKVVRLVLRLVARAQPDRMPRPAAPEPQWLAERPAT